MQIYTLSICVYFVSESVDEGTHSLFLRGAVHDLNASSNL